MWRRFFQYKYFIGIFLALLVLGLGTLWSSTSIYELPLAGVQNATTKRNAPEHVPTPESVKAIYMTSWIAGSPNLRRDLVDFIDSSEANSIVIDIKDYSGKVAFVMDDSVVASFEPFDKRMPDIENFIKELHKKNIYVIGRISVFQDPHATRVRPDLAVTDKRGGVWKDRKKLSFIDPGAREYWNYIVHMAKGSYAIGFDEINFDYIRFPSDGVLANATYPHTGSRPKADVLEDFFTYLERELEGTGIITSADLFGLVTWAVDDLGIGQVLERAAPHFDYVAPMVYPSHYASGFQNFSNPAEHPYEIILTSMELAAFRLKQIGEPKEKLRPWIQDFDLGAEYGAREIHLQKKGVYDAGLTSWMSWDPSNRYTKEAYR